MQDSICGRPDIANADGYSNEVFGGEFILIAM